MAAGAPLTFEKALAREAKRLRIPLSPRERERFLRLYDMLARWNTRMSLTGLRRAGDIARVLFAESLLPGKLHGPLRGALLDVGSGAGFPALPLAVRYSALRVTMVEANARKAVFLREAVAALALSNAEVVNMRLEEAVRQSALARSYDCFTLRGVGHVAEIFPLLAPLAAARHAAFAFVKDEHRAACRSMPGVRVAAEKKISETTWLLNLRFVRERDLSEEE